MSARIFREEALRRHTAPARQPQPVDAGARRFVILWGVVVVLLVTLSLLTWPLLGGDATDPPAPASVGVVGGGRGGGR